MNSHARFFALMLLLLVSTYSARAENAAVVVVAPDNDGLTSIWVSGNDSTTTLSEIEAQLGPHAALLEEVADAVWELNANLIVESGVTLVISSAAGVDMLRLRSDQTGFVYLRTNDGTLHFEQVHISSWNGVLASPDHDLTDGRSYLLARGDATMNFHEADVGYLGWSDAESYGVSWRDQNDPAEPDILRSRVTGHVTNSAFHHNYYGIYTHQASHMTFRENSIHDNIRYGFDPHDFTHDVLVENNIAYRNGSHGFIISRGCFNFTFRGNIAYENHDPGANLAHGFMLDPGSPNSSVPQSPSHHNILENNEAYDNEGYGLRVRDSHDNLFADNHFHNNLQGIVLDSGSQANVVENNQLFDNSVNGLYLRGSAANNQLTGNTASGNGNHGVYIKSDGNLIDGNLAVSNAVGGFVVLPESDSDTGVVTDNVFNGNIARSNERDGFELKSVRMSSFFENISEENGRHGFYLTNSSQNNELTQNSIRLNGEQGIRVNGALTFQNRWSMNQIFDNLDNGIRLTSDANRAVEVPLIIEIVGYRVSGIAPPNSHVEIFSDGSNQGQYFEGESMADATGRFSFTNTRAWMGPWVTAIATTVEGDSSAFSGAIEVRYLLYLSFVNH